MLQQLRRKFTKITCLLLAAVLLCVQSLTVISSYLSLQETVHSSLQHSLDSADAEAPILGNTDTNISIYNHLLVAKITISSTGTIISSNSGMVHVAPSALTYIVNSVKDGVRSGSVEHSHLVFDSRQTPDGQLRIAIADTTTVDTSLNRQISLNFVVFALVMALSFITAWILSKKVLMPVERSWIQQKRFIADASHELKTPLAVILANTQILKRRQHELPEQDRVWVQATAEEAQRMKGLVEDLLDLTRSELAREDKTIQVQEDVNLSVLIDRICLQFDAVAFEHGCTIETRLTPDIHITGDPSEMEKLVKILVDNACKYARPKSAIRVELERQSRSIELRVQNEGDPIDPDELPHVFERFYRSDKVRSRNQSGSYGLGLAIAQSITQEHRGKIHVSSSAEDGTTFTCCFPRRYNAS